MREQQNNRHERTTIGLDLGDRWHRFCVLGESGQVMEEGSVANNRVALSELSGRYPGALIVMEAGCHSPWVSRHLEQAGCEVIVSNPRKTRAIYQHERKSDRRDALMLARIARMEPALLSDYVRAGTKAERTIRSCASANVATLTCDGSWSARLSIFWDRSLLRALCASTD
jgi:transposase